jgi:hypothetical protein
VYRLKAGLGLLTVRDIVPHGEWAEFLAGRFPERSHRTLSRYMAEAGRFCQETGLKARAAWDALGAEGAVGRLLPDPDGARAAPARGILGKVAEWLFGEPRDVSPRALTDEEQRLAARDGALRDIGSLRRWADGGMAGADEAALEELAAGLTACMRRVRRALEEARMTDAEVWGDAQ